MIKDIVRDILFLQRKAEPATKDDWQVGRDLVDTLESKLDTCAGLAANMIGSTKAVILFRQGNKSVVMYNPEILKTSPAPYDAEEGCLSLDGRRPCKGTTRSRSSSWIPSSGRRRRPSRDLRQKSSSTKSTTCMGF